MIAKFRLFKSEKAENQPKKGVTRGKSPLCPSDDPPPALRREGSEGLSGRALYAERGAGGARAGGNDTNARDEGFSLNLAHLLRFPRCSSVR